MQSKQDLYTKMGKNSSVVENQGNLKNLKQEELKKLNEEKLKKE